jgi:4-aminobutyrate aminotransferase-like enzyme
LTVQAADNVIRLVPPLVIDEPEVEQALAILGQVLAESEPGLVANGG